MLSRCLVLLPLLLLSACSEDEKTAVPSADSGTDASVDPSCQDAVCPTVYLPPVSLEVKPPEGQVLPDVTVTGATSECTRVSFPDGFFACSIGEGTGRYVLDIQAPGFRPVYLEVDVAVRPRTACDCCSPGYAPQRLGLRLEPAN